ncbi:HAMP domain-containing protein [Panacibacter ginsenosidivorans]|uniref:histidine kinase n=1 Tax=Panacibacter ginsenosidivorans TaxID=1813871 RepID=A0A5B8VF28_9BACT|nr:ATP-binding protein [Panacibacter ginsenosidivorans]QEC68928.1 HAMP domain-containing protein [Panacibacter ginsenosidivorans]
MKLRTKYLLFVIILHLTALVLSFFIFKDDKLIFIISEVFILLSAFISWQLYNELIQPLKMLMQGTEAIKDRDFNIKFVETGKYEMDQLINVYNQMIDQLRTERTKQEEQHFFLEKLIQTSPTGIMILDYEDRVQQINPMALQLLNIKEKEVVGKSIDAIEHPVMKQLKLLPSGKSATVTFDAVTTYKLQKSHFIDRGFPRHFIMIEELTAEILAAEKKAYGKVIRMMAHEVNNTVGPVNSIIQSTLQSQNIWKENETSNLHNALQVAFDRNNNLNIFMRNFADVVRLPEPHLKKVDLIKIIHGVSQLMQMKAGEKQVEFIYELRTNSFLIDADEQQLEQALINIVKNAIEAITDKGKIIFDLNAQARQLVVTDTGSGINVDVASNLFSPFFSTKKDGQGIGLTLVKEILLNHGFTFSLKTVKDGQTEFAIQF